MKRRLASGPFQIDPQRGTSVWGWELVAEVVAKGRHMFLQSVNQIEPMVIDDLIESHTNICGKTDGPEFVPIMPDWASFANDPELAAVVVELNNWAVRWHLTDHWCLEAAVETFNSWHGVVDRPRRFAAPLGKMVVPQNLPALPDFLGRTFTLTLPGWDPLAETRKDFETRAKSDFQKKLAEYSHEIQSLASSSPYLISVPEKRSFDAFHWTAGYQICGWSLNKIAGAAGFERQSVETAVKQTAKLIELTLRPTREYEKGIEVEAIQKVLKRLLRGDPPAV